MGEDSRRVDVLTEVTIRRPRGRVAAYVADPDNAPEWYVNIKSVTWRTPPPLAVGTELEFEARFLGRSLRYTYEVLDLVAGERMVMRTAEGPFPMETTYTWNAIDEHTTRMTLRNRGEPPQFASLVGKLTSRAVRRANRKDLDRLRSILEAPPGG